MPTGYTAPVQNGNITELRPFAMQCARAFGALIMMRDDPMDAPIPAKLEPQTDYHDNALAAALARLAALGEMAPEQYEAEARIDHRQRIAAWEERKATRGLQRKRYSDMLAKVSAWTPPEAVAELKKFMLEQLTSSIDFDCSGSYDDAPSALSGMKWFERESAKARHDIEYHTKQRAEEIERTAGRNLWLDALRVSLVDPATI